MLYVPEFDKFPEDGKHVGSDPQEKRKPELKSYQTVKADLGNSKPQVNYYQNGGGPGAITGSIQLKKQCPVVSTPVGASAQVPIYTLTDKGLTPQAKTSKL